MPPLSASSTAVQQIIAFLEALVLGMLYAAAYDLYRSIRAQFRRLPFAPSFIADCCFWIAAAVATVVFLFYRRWGEIYAYTYGGIAGGFVIYFYCFSEILYPLWRRAFGALFRPLQSRAGISGGSGELTGIKGRRFKRKCRIFHPFRRN